MKTSLNAVLMPHDFIQQEVMGMDNEPTGNFFSPDHLHFVEQWQAYHDPNATLEEKNTRNLAVNDLLVAHPESGARDRIRLAELVRFVCGGEVDLGRYAQPSRDNTETAKGVFRLFAGDLKHEDTLGHIYQVKRLVLPTSLVTQQRRSMRSMGWGPRQNDSSFRSNVGLPPLGRDLVANRVQRHIA